MNKRVGLVIGVTGHRTLPQPARTVDTVRVAIAEILRRSATATNGVAVISPLAEGADRLVARCVLEIPGARLDAIFPMPREDYVKDFATNSSRREFDALVERAAEITVLPPQPTRSKAYAAAGRHVVDGCDVLIAIWNGKSHPHLGGTDDTVAYARSRGRAIYRIDSESPSDFIREP